LINVQSRVSNKTSQHPNGTKCGTKVLRHSYLIISSRREISHRSQHITPEGGCVKVMWERGIVAVPATDKSSAKSSSFFVLGSCHFTNAFSPIFRVLTDSSSCFSGRILSNDPTRSPACAPSISSALSGTVLRRESRHMCTRQDGQTWVASHVSVHRRQYDTQLLGIGLFRHLMPRRSSHIT
jgi:hypothetical protein